MSPKSKRRKTFRKPDRHVLYEAAVQSVDADIDFIRRVYKKKNGRTAKLLREDFCGTAALACLWAEGNDDRRAWGVDLDGDTLDWCREHRLPRIGSTAERVVLVQEDVRTPREPKVDVTVAFNFSYFTFRDRPTLRGYFENVRQSLAPGGVFLVDLFGGTESMTEIEERRKIGSSRAPDGSKVPGFHYYWEQASFNPVDHEIVCHIHFKVPGRKKRIKRAFTYHWRLWTIPELRELLDEAGFASSEVYAEGWDDDAEDGDGNFRKKSRFENDAGWIAYVVGYVD